MGRPRPVIVSASATGVTAALAQDESRHDEYNLTSVLPSSARFQIVQSTLGALQTFKLDKVTGNVQLIVSKVNGGTGWEDLVVEGRERIVPKENRFQIFMSGLAGKFTFLLDTETGTRWQFASTEDEKTKEKTYFFSVLSQES